MLRYQRLLTRRSNRSPASQQMLALASTLVGVPSNLMTSAEKPRRSDLTRAEILRAAQERFASDGYHRATIRAIAADANIDPSMVMRYYGTKAQLFAAAVDIDLRLPDLAVIPRRRLGETLVTHFLARWEGDPADDALLILLRSAATDDAAAERVRAIFRHQLAPAVNRIVADPVEAAGRAGLIATQLLGLALCRHILRLPPVASLRRETVVAQVGPTIQRYLTGHGRGR
jgi:AcrR family transcriptional regulator